MIIDELCSSDSKCFTAQGLKNYGSVSAVELYLLHIGTISRTSPY